jgi:NADPH:quinone reductase-like Zn-dependent oxidoreductase
MRAVQIVAFGGPEQLRLVDVPRPQPRGDEVLVRVARCGVNPVDRSQLTGRWSWLQLPHTPGSEISGTVEATGELAGPLRPGQRVAVALRVFCGRCHYCLQGREEACNADPHSATAPIMVGLPSEGGYADFVIAPARNVIPLAHATSVDAACVATLDGVTAWHETDRAGVGPGDRVLVTGATGGLGTLFIQIAKLRGATVYAVTGRGGMADRLRELGADQVIDRSTEDVARRARDLTGGRGVDVVLDSVGAGMFSANLAALAPLGRLAICGILTGPDVQLNLAPFYAQQQQIVGSTGGSRRDLELLLDAMDQGRVRPVIWRHYPLDQAASALAALGDPERFGKVILDVA